MRWYHDANRVAALERNHGLSQATAYRYLHEGIDVLAAEAPELHEALAQTRAEGLPYLTLNGTLIPTDRLTERIETGNHAWYSGKHKRFGGNIQILAGPISFPIWTSPVELRLHSRHHVLHASTACRPCTRPPPRACRPWPRVIKALGLPVVTPIKGRNFGMDNKTYIGLLSGMRAIGKRANALLDQRWTALRYVTLSPSRIRAIVAGALVFTAVERETR